MQVSIDELRHAIESRYGGKAHFVEFWPIKDVRKGKTLWEGTVYAFDLRGHPMATRAFAWPSAVAGSRKRQLFAVLNLKSVSSPHTAVHAALAAEQRAGKRPG
jgi:hypothetical protein